MDAVLHNEIIKFFTDEHLLYLLEQPKTSGPMRCDFVEEANAERLYVRITIFSLNLQKSLSTVEIECSFK